MTRVLKLPLLCLVMCTIIMTGCQETPTTTTGNTRVADLYDRLPGVSGCDEGALKMSEKQKALDRLNLIRSLHNLPVVTYNLADDVYAQKAAEICAANQTLNHQPPQSYKCWSAEGATGCGTGNLWEGSQSSGDPSTIIPWSTASIIDSWLSDSDVESIGHRRWLLNPFLKTVAFGRVDFQSDASTLFSTASIKVFDDVVQFSAISTTVTGIGFPQGNYPSAAFDKTWYLSYSLLIDQNNYWNNNAVDYSSAVVEMFDPNNTPVPVSAVKFDTDGIGLPNNIQWKAAGLQDNTQYTVRIRNVKANGLATPTASYTFTLAP